MLFDKIAGFGGGFELDNRSSRTAHYLGSGLADNNINGSTRPWVANLERLLYSGLDDNRGWDSIVHLDVNLRLASHKDTAIEIPSCGNGWSNTDEPVIILNQSFLQCVAGDAALFDVELHLTWIWTVLVLLTTAREAIYAPRRIFRTPKKRCANFVSHIEARSLDRVKTPAASTSR